jgi:hypothetical protein
MSAVQVAAQKRLQHLTEGVVDGLDTAKSAQKRITDAKQSESSKTLKKLVSKMTRK